MVPFIQVIYRFELVDVGSMPKYRTKTAKTSKALKKKVVKKGSHKLARGSSKMPHFCATCFIQLPNSKVWMAHLRAYHSDDEQYRFDEALLMYACGSCDESTPIEKEMQDHVAQEHCEKFTCEHCKIDFTKAFSYCCHMHQHSEDKKYICVLCDSPLRTPSALYTHLNSKHYKRFKFVCETCGKGFIYKDAYEQHQNEHLGVRPYACVVCDKSFVYSSYLHTHQVRHHTVGILGMYAPNQCPFCGMNCAKEVTLQKHIQSRHIIPESANHLCDICGKGFRFKDKLKIHYRIHTGDKPYQCRFCEKAFSKKENMENHERCHTGEKPFSCTYCGKCFNQRAPLKIHVRRHTGECPYVCDFCNKGFASSGARNSHKKNCNGL